MVHLHNGILYGSEDKPSTNTCNNMKESQNDVEWKKSNTKKYIYGWLQWYNYIIVICSVRGQDSGDLWRGGR